MSDESKRSFWAPVYAVLVDGRDDGLYLFWDRSDAERFRDAVIDSSFGGTTAMLSEEPVADGDQAIRLIEAEVGD